MSETNFAPGLQEILALPVKRPPAGEQRPVGVGDPLVAANPRVFAGASFFQIAFSFAAMLGACLVARVFYSLRSFHVDPDLWWHLKVGQDILATHHWPVADPYSFSAPGYHWLAYEWLGDVLLASVWHAGGLLGLGVLLVALGGLTALALYYFTSARCGNPKAGFLATAVLLNLVNFFTLRPQMLGFLFLVLSLIVLEDFRRRESGAIRLLPAIMLLWVNTHGSWVIGIATIGVYLASGLTDFRFGSLATVPWTSRARRNLAIAFGLCCVATLITPYGTALARYPFEVASSLPSNLMHVQEWRPLEFRLPGDKLFLVLVLGFLLVQMVTRHKWRLEEIGLFLFGTGMACLHMRFLLIFVPFFAPLFAVILGRWLPRYDRSKEIYVLNGAIILGIAATIILYFPSGADYARTVRETSPVGAVEYLKTHAVPEPMYNNYAFGGYLILTRAPEHKVFIDGRGEFYEDAGVFSDDVQLLDLKAGSLDLFRKYGIQSCLITPSEPLATVLAQLPEWQKVYADNNSVLFVRR